MRPDLLAATGALAGTFGLPTQVVAPVRWDGCQVIAFGTLDQAEVARRHGIGFGWEHRRRVVEQLADSVGGGWSAELAAWDPELQWAVEHCAGGPAVAARPPVCVAAVALSGADPVATINRASHLAPLGQRIAVVTQGDLDDVLLRAAWLEVGVATITVTEEGVTKHADPGPRVGDDLAYRWWFSELVYGSHLGLLAQQRRHPSAA